MDKVRVWEQEEEEFLCVMSWTQISVAGSNHRVLCGVIYSCRVDGALPQKSMQH